MSDDAVHVDHGTVIPPWMKWVGGIAATTIIGLAATLLWGLMGGGITQAMETAAANVIEEKGIDKGEISELTVAVTQLTATLETERVRDAEYREEVRNRFDAIDQRMETLTRAMLELSQ